MGATLNAAFVTSTSTREFLSHSRRLKENFALVFERTGNRANMVHVEVMVTLHRFFPTSHRRQHEPE